MKGTLPLVPKQEMTPRQHAHQQTSWCVCVYVCVDVPNGHMLSYCPSPLTVNGVNPSRHMVGNRIARCVLLVHRCSLFFMALLVKE